MIRRKRGWVMAVLTGNLAVALLFTGCAAKTEKTPASEPATSGGAPAVAPELQNVAESVLGKAAQVIAQGDLAGNGLEQIVVINRYGQFGPNAGSTIPDEFLVTRAAILEKSGERWTEVLRCDERLKNPQGYLGGSPAGSVTGWKLKVRTDAQRGLELEFAPADATSRPVVVRWNTKTKRYQSLDRSKERFLGEAPPAGTPQSILR